jgi:hypothetical protein
VKLFNHIYDVKFRDAYFGASQEREEFASESESHQERRRDAEKLEVTHLVYIAAGEWERFWTWDLGNSPMESMMNAMFFYYFALQAGETITAQMCALICLPLWITIYRRLYRSNQPWPFSLITKCETIPVNEQLCKYQPRSDLLILKSSLLRLLIEVNSEPSEKWPYDPIQMLLTGAAVVRFANTFLDTFKKEKNFVFFAIYVQDNGRATCYTIFQEPKNPAV